MRVLVLSQWYPPEKAAIPADIAEGLAGRGHEVSVLTGFPNYPTGKVYEGWRQRAWLDTRVQDYRVRRVALYPSHDTSPVRRAAGYLSFGATSTVFGWPRLRAADVIYVYHPPLTAAIGPWINRLFGGAPYVLHVQDLWPDSVLEAGMLPAALEEPVRGLLTRICDSTYHRASGVVAIAPTMAAILHQRGVPEERLHVVPNWADESIFFPVARKASTGEQIGLTGYFTVMFAGNIGELQGLDTAICAAARVRDLPAFRLALVGSGVARYKLQALARSVQADNVLFVDPQPLERMNDVAAAADVQLVSLKDLDFLRGTIPSKLGTLLASGLPIICAVNGDAKDLVESAGAGWTCASESVEELERAFRDAYRTPREVRQALGSAGRAYYESHLASQKGVARIEHILRSAHGTGSTVGLN